MKSMVWSLTVVCVTAAVMLSSGCAAMRQSVATVDAANAGAFDAKYDQNDLRTMTDEVAGMLLMHPLISKASERPLVVILGIDNRTTEHLDTQAMAEALRNKLLNSGKIRFISASRRKSLLAEQGYQAENASDSTRVGIGKQLGAKYMITGAMIELKKETGRQVRVSKKQEIYYKFGIEFTDVETGELLAAPSTERARVASKPIIGW